MNKKLKLALVQVATVAIIFPYGWRVMKDHLSWHAYILWIVVFCIVQLFIPLFFPRFVGRYPFMKLNKGQ